MNIRKHVTKIKIFALLFFLLIGYSSYVKYEGAKLEDENKTLKKQLDIANEKIKEQKNELDDLL